MRGATYNWREAFWTKLISIHAPHAGRDSALKMIHSAPTNFNPRAPCGARHILNGLALVWPKFQSTRPMRGATEEDEDEDEDDEEISIHAPHAGRDP